MLRTTEWNRPRSWGALLAIVVASGAVLWQILACWESPMSFSPKGDLAFTVVDPYEEESQLLAGERTYRLLVLGQDRQLRELERSSTHMLSGAAFSPDGRQLAYLRVALPSKEDLARAKAFEQRLQSDDAKVKEAALKEKWTFAAPPAMAGRAPKPLHEAALDVGLPPAIGLKEGLPSSGALLPAELVVRDAATGAAVSSLPIDVPLNWNEGAGPLDYTYLFARPQWLPEGMIYFYLHGHTVSATVAGGQLRLLAAGGFPGPVSPDGRIVASLNDDGDRLQLAATDGSRSVYLRLLHKAFLLGSLAWVGADALAVLSNEKPGEFVVDVVDREGRALRSQTLTLAGEVKEKRIELAISPDAKTMVIGLGNRVHFLTVDGKPLGEWQAQTDKELLVRPTFAPDSQQVAFRLLAQGDEEQVRTAAIVFFSPQGQELFRVAVPPLAAVAPAAPASAASVPAAPASAR